ncbi:MAG: hypothetical protein SNJ67_11340 [Chloracidobacterium sp.]|uniref:Uncharacterized protein n=1 Tax=Chloracidobacterium validum TaxID=2821543 RepID=A0ABX8B721_9BACT|nr:hypothetical protein [Chloracidobacterium validum]QUW02753.1 hypothetical protein J8C06_10505 [Chloracidobacterium validum]
MTGCIYGWLVLFTLVVIGQAQTPEPARREFLADRLVATVNGDAITQSDLVWFLAFDPSINLISISEADLQRVLSAKLDLLLLSQEAARFPLSNLTAEEVASAKQRLIKLFPSEAVFRERLESVGLDAETFDRLIRERLQVEKYINFRFQTFVLVTDDDVLTYYETEIRPKLAAAGTVAPETPNEEQRTLIVEILSRERAEREQRQWLEAARRRADIVPLAPYAKTLTTAAPEATTPGVAPPQP